MLAILFPVLLGFAGLCVDLGVVALARSQLQTVADAAALAGAKQLNDPGRISTTFDLTADIAAARQKAIALAQANLVLGKPAVVLDNPNNSPSGDVVVGYKDITTKNSALVAAPTSQSLINSVQVVARRDASHTSLVPSFFSRALGFSDTSLQITSTATVQNYGVKGFKTTQLGVATKLIPIALSLTTWNAMRSGLTTDNYTYNSQTKTVTSGADGIYESTMYPVGSGAGNFGTVNIGTSSNGTSVLASKITTGVTTDDLFSTGQTSGGYYTLNPSTTMPGNPGVSLGIKSALLSQVGHTVLVPIYDPSQSSGNGANYTYTIVGFAPVVVLNTAFNGVHSTFIVQPALMSADSTVVAGSPQPWTSGGVVLLHLSQ